MRPPDVADSRGADDSDWKRNESTGSAICRIADFLGARSLVAVTGGGGKTTLLAALAEHVSKTRNVLVTTTTKLCADDAENLVLGKTNAAMLRHAFAEKNFLTLADRVENGKLIGVAPEALDGLFRGGVADHVLVEADGARRMPFKAYESWEPVVPSTATLQIVVVGAEIFFEIASEKNIFRLDLLRDRYGVEPGRIVPFETIVRLLESRDEYLRGAPSGAHRVLVINKCDLFPNSNEAKKIADGLARSLASYDALLLASFERDALHEYRPLERRA